MTTLVTPTPRQLAYVQLTDPELTNQIWHRVRDLHTRTEEIFGTRPGSTAAKLAECDRRAEAIHAALVGGLGADRVAQAVMRSLVGRAEAGQAEFWETALGRVVALWGGYPQPTMPRLHAAALLDVTRQRVSQMEAAGLLQAASLSATSGAQIVTTSLTRLLVPA